MKYDVSVLVPVYNVALFIERCCHSLFGQSYKNIQFVFIDDCTPDNSIEIIRQTLEEYPDRKEHVKIIKHDKNKGLAGSRNTGLENAEGEYILNIDSDDYVELDMVEQMFGLAKKENADVVICDFIIEWEKTSKISYQNFINKEQYFKDLLNTRVMPGVVNKLIKKQLYIENSIFAFEGINLGEDYVTTPKLIFKAENIVKINKPFYHYIQYNTGSYTATIKQKSIDDLWFVLNELFEYFKSLPIFLLIRDDLFKGQLIKKIDIVEKIEKSRRKEIFLAFPESNTVFSKSNLTINQKIIYYLANNNQYGLLNLYLKVYKNFFLLIQKLKGR